MSFSNILIYWYLQNKRDLPWRNTKNPYFIWLSEIILQQTRVNQGLDYYTKFITSFPTIFDLANASEESVLKLWQGLGYYSRARNLHYSAKYIVKELNGNFPGCYNDLIKLKGVGDYTASAIASICFNEPTAVVDGNVYRVLARYFGLNTPINSTKGIKEFKQLSQLLQDPEKPDMHNQAIMEFGAVQCKPQNPDCNGCPLNNSCIAWQKNQVDSFPVKEKKKSVKKRYFNYLVICDIEGRILLKQRRNKDIWQGLYEFPLVETPNEIQQNELVNTPNFNKIVPNKKASISLFNTGDIIHKLTHQHLYTKFWIIEIDKKIDKSITWLEFEKYPVPILIHNFVENFKTKA
jgi:A/G-specific adenine glycosylase